MTGAESRAEVFWMAFRSLPKAERQKVIARLLRDPDFTEDLMDIAIAKKRSKESVRPFEEYLAEQQQGERIR